MSKKKRSLALAEEEQKQYEEARQRYGEDLVDQSVRRWNSYSDAQQEQIKQEGRDIYVALAAAMPTGYDSDQVQDLLVQWHENLRHFYEPSIEVIGGLGTMYHDDPEFHAFFADIHPDLPGFLSEAIAVYADHLETAWLQQELGILEH